MPDPAYGTRSRRTNRRPDALRSAADAARSGHTRRIGDRCLRQQRMAETIKLRAWVAAPGAVEAPSLSRAARRAHFAHYRVAESGTNLRLAPRSRLEQVGEHCSAPLGRPSAVPAD